MKSSNVVFKNSNGYAIYWFHTKTGTRTMYRVFYNDGRPPLATNTMSIVYEQLKHEKEVTTNQTGQLSLFNQ